MNDSGTAVRRREAARQGEAVGRKLDPLSGNHVVGFSHSSNACIGSFDSQPAQLRQENGSMGTAAASGIFRWLSNDPIGINGGLNQYVFVGNNPINRADPLGLSANNIVSNVSSAQVIVTTVVGGWNLASWTMGPSGQPWWQSSVAFTPLPNGYCSQTTVNGPNACNTVNGSPVGAGSLLFSLVGPPGTYNVNLSCNLALSGSGHGGAHANLFYGTNQILGLYGGAGNPTTLHTNYLFLIAVTGSNPVLFFQYQPSIGIGSAGSSGAAFGTITYTIFP